LICDARRQIRREPASQRELLFLEREHGSFDPIDEPIPRGELSVPMVLLFEAHVEDGDPRKLCDQTKHALEDPNAVVLADDSSRSRDASAAGDEFSRVDLLANQQAMIPLEQHSVLPYPGEAVAPIAVADRDRRQAELGRIEGLVDIEEPYRHPSPFEETDRTALHQSNFT